MRVVFMGSSEASATALRALLKSPMLNVVGVVTQPDRPSGRRQHLTPCPGKAYATQRGLKNIITPEKVNAPEVVAHIEQLKPDVIVVVAFGQILGKRLLTLPPHGCINGHFSILPAYRGAAPVSYAIADGNEVTGVTIMQMAEGMDDGDILLKAMEPICSDDTAGTLMERLAILCAVTIVKALKLMVGGQLVRRPQDHAAATNAPKMRKTDGLMDWRKPATVLERQVRAFDPWPGSYTFMPGHLTKSGQPLRVKVLQSFVMPLPDEVAALGLAPGTVSMISPVGPVVVTGSKQLCLTAVQPDGSRQMDGRAFLNGHPMHPGECFGNQ